MFSTILDIALRQRHIFSLNYSLPGSPIKISCLRADQGQLSELLEKERQRMHKTRVSAAKEEAYTLEGRANQPKVEIRNCGENIILQKCKSTALQRAYSKGAT
ncbi:hypothetical protein Bca4012_020600 [Brassica carinata]|uniref:Uncharacterized protein n=1 Tax=Brassica carinata TaxID=52824 RepID=A0A8X8BDH0_BRACI|nr:hypothetical protein Bca52824_001057 [Brassica carinata]